MYKNRLILLALLATLLVRCTPPESTTQSIGIGHGVSRFIDKEAQIVCYVLEGFYRGGISCLPISETTLEIGDND